MKDELNQYNVAPGRFWEDLPVLGIDGYSAMELAQKLGWRAIGDWGQAGYNLGSWPLVMVFFREREGTFEVAEYVEGDVAIWSCPTEAIREAVTNELAFFHWKHASNGPDVGTYQSVDALPDALKGPYRPTP